MKFYLLAAAVLLTVLAPSLSAQSEACLPPEIDDTTCVPTDLPVGPDDLPCSEPAEIPGCVGPVPDPCPGLDVPACLPSPSLPPCQPGVPPANFPCIPDAPDLNDVCTDLGVEGGEFPGCLAEIQPPVTPEDVLAAACEADDSLPVCQPLPTPPSADGLVGSFQTASGGPPAAVPAVVLTEAGLDVVVDAQRRAGDAYGPATGSLRLVAQTDCGAFEPVAGGAVPCQGNMEILADDTADGVAGLYTFHLEAAPLRAAFAEGAPTTGIHLFVEQGPAYSHYLLGNDALLAADPALADTAEAVTFTPLLLIDEAALPAPTDGFTASISVTGALPTGQASVLLPSDAPTVEVVATPFVIDEEGVYRIDDSGLYALRFFYLDATAETPAVARVPANEEDPVYLLEADGAPLTFTVPTADLPAFADTGGNGFTVQLIQLEGPSESTSAYSNLFLPKEALLAPGNVGNAALYTVADALDGNEAFTPLLVSADPRPADGFIAVIEPQNALRTAVGSVVELDVANQAAFDICAFDAAGNAYGFTDFRLEFGGLPREPAADADSMVIVSAGTYNLPADGIQLAPNNGDNCHTVRLAGAGLLAGDAQPQRMFTAAFWVPYAMTGKTSRYSEEVNALAGADNFEAADQMDLAASSGLAFMGRRMSPTGPGDLSPSALLADQEAFLATAQAVLGHVVAQAPSPPDECPAPTAGEFPACVDGLVPEACPPPTSGEFPACVPALPDECPDPTQGNFPACTDGVPSVPPDLLPCDPEAPTECIPDAAPQGFNGLPGWVAPFASLVDDARAAFSDLFPWFQS